MYTLRSLDWKYQQAPSGIQYTVYVHQNTVEQEKVKNTKNILAFVEFGSTTLHVSYKAMTVICISAFLVYLLSVRLLEGLPKLAWKSEGLRGGANSNVNKRHELL